MLLALLLLTLPPFAGAGWAADPPRGGWKGALKKAFDLADELSAYPVRHDVFTRACKTLEAGREELEEAGVATAASFPPELPDRLRETAMDLQTEQRQVRDIILEFGKGLEFSYEGAFSDFAGRAEELAVLLERVREVVLAVESRFRAGAAGT
jgi:hypothetical protein